MSTTRTLSLLKFFLGEDSFHVTGISRSVDSRSTFLVPIIPAKTSRVAEKIQISCSPDQFGLNVIN